MVEEEVIVDVFVVIINGLPQMRLIVIKLSLSFIKNYHKLFFFGQIINY